MRNYTLYGLIFILFLSIASNPNAQEIKKEVTIIETMSDEELLIKAIENSDFNIEEANINASTFIEDTFLSMEDLEKEQEKVINALNIKGKVEIIHMEDIYNYGYENYFEDLSNLEDDAILVQKTEEEGFNQIIVFSPDEEGNMTVLKFLSTQIVEEKETYIIVDIVKNKGYKEVVSISNQCREILGQYNGKVETTVSFVSGYIGQLDKSEQNKNQEDIFEYLDAKKIEVMEDELFTSITAYSPFIKTYVQYGENKVNLQLAMRYNEYENKTYLWLANPLITTTY